MRSAAIAFGAALAARVLVVGEVAVGSAACTTKDVEGEPGEKLARVLDAAKPKPTAALSFVVVLREGGGMSVLDATEEGAARRRWEPVLSAGDVVFVPKQPAKGTPPWTQWSVRAAALPAMLASGVDGPRRAWLQTELLKTTGDRAVRQQMALELARCPDSALGVRMLVSVLDLDLCIAREAVVALGTMGPAATAALPELERLRDHRDQKLRELVAVAIRQIAGGPAQSAERCASACTDREVTGSNSRSSASRPAP
jgi:hypothetical protein